MKNIFAIIAIALGVFMFNIFDQSAIPVWLSAAISALIGLFVFLMPLYLTRRPSVVGRKWQMPGTAPMTPEERVEDLRQYKGHLKRQLRKTDKQIDETMLQRIREAGLGA